MTDHVSAAQGRGVKITATGAEDTAAVSAPQQISEPVTGGIASTGQAAAAVYAAECPEDGLRYAITLTLDTAPARDWPDEREIRCLGCGRALVLPRLSDDEARALMEDDDDD